MNSTSIRTTVLSLLPLASAFGQAPPPPPPPPSTMSAVAPAPAAPADPNKVVLVVGDEKMTASEFDNFVNALPEQYRGQATGPNKRQFVEQLIRLKILANAAKTEGLDKTPAIQRQMAFQKENLLAGAYFNDLNSKVKVDDAAVQKYYTEHKNEFETANARHILIRVKGAPMPAAEGAKELTDEEALAKAQAIRKRLSAGEDFAKVAQAESDDKGSGAQGGDLGTFGRGQMVPAFEQTAFSAPVGQVSEPVKSPFGYHLIKVEKRESKPLAEVKDELAKRLKPEIARQAVEDLRKKTPVTIDDTFFGGLAPAITPGLAPPGGGR